MSQPFERVAACHCESCKKISGGVGTASGRARSEDVRILEGRELITSYQPGEGSAKSFCSVCGTNLFGGGWPESEFCSVRLSALDRAVRGPDRVRTSSSAPSRPWEVLPDDGAERTRCARRDRTTSSSG